MTASCDTLIKGSAIFVISSKKKLILVNFVSQIYHIFNPVESTCIKVISQVFLDNAKLWSDALKNTELRS
jgi:hypothetical protein